MKKLIFILFIIPLAAFGQEGFYIGGHADNGLYWLYNKADFTVDDESILDPLPPSAFDFNNYRAGIVAGVGLNEKISLETNILYSANIQKYRNYAGVTIDGANYMYSFSKINYFKVNAVCEFDLADPYENNIIPFIKIGPQISYLINFNDERVQEVPGGHGGTYANKNGIITQRNYSNYILYYSFDGTTDEIYNKWVLGANLALGVKIPVSEHFNINVSLSGSYDFTNTDNKNANLYSADTLIQKYWLNKYYHWWSPATETRARLPSHNIYAGIGITLNYYFRSRWDY